MNRSDYQLDVDISIVLFDIDNMVDITNKTMFLNNSILSPKVKTNLVLERQNVYG